MHFCMKHLLFILMTSLLLLASCGEKTSQKALPVREGIQWGEIHFGAPDELGYTEEATLLYTTADGTVDSVDFMLSFPIEPEDFADRGGGEIEEEDINFDGIPDLQICLGAWDGYWNMTYEGFVWDKEKGAVVNVTNYSGIFNPWIEETERCIISNYREWMDGVQYRTYEKYEWVDGAMVMTDEWADDFALNEEDESEEE